MSLPITDTLDILRAHLTDPALLQRIGKDLIKAEKEAKESKTTEKRGKTRLVALVRQDKGSPVLGGAYILSVPDTDTTDTYSGDGLLNRLRAAAQEHNDNPKRSRKSIKVTKWDELFRNVKAKTFKVSGSVIGVKAKGNAHELVILDKETLA